VTSIPVPLDDPDHSSSLVWRVVADFPTWWGTLPAVSVDMLNILPKANYGVQNSDGERVEA
jgi:hypothetical protein